MATQSNGWRAKKHWAPAFAGALMAPVLDYRNNMRAVAETDAE